jgi:putative glutathione S-transferase
MMSTPTSVGTTRAVTRFAREIGASGEFVRQGSRFSDRVTADGASGFPVAPDRYQLIASPACPCSHRVVIVRRLLGLGHAIGVSTVAFAPEENDWRFVAEPGDDCADLGLESLGEAYLATDPGYTGRITVPALYDRRTRRVVSNDSAQIALDMCTEWDVLHAPHAPDLYPRRQRAHINAMDALIYSDISDGVYGCGLATTPEAYAEAYHRLFARLDWFAGMLSAQRYLLGTQITGPDILLFTTLVRFDAVYYGHFKCNRNTLTEMPVLWAYARDLFQAPGFGDTVHFDQIRRHFYGNYPSLNPNGIVPLGPDPAGWRNPHDRR